MMKLMENVVSALKKIKGVMQQSKTVDESGINFGRMVTEAANGHLKLCLNFALINLLFPFLPKWEF